jgi:hypothetical protein
MAVNNCAAEYEITNEKQAFCFVVKQNPLSQQKVEFLLIFIHAGVDYNVSFHL